MISPGKMKRIIISTIIRNVPADQPSGSLYIFDLSSGKTLQKSTIIEPPHRERDNNHRGGIRGLRGIIVREDQIILSNASEIFRYDASWRLLGRFSHPSCGSIHDIICQNDTIWLTSSRNDLLIRFDIYQQKIISRHNFSDNTNESIYDINMLPDHFDLPPSSFI